MINFLKNLFKHNHKWQTRGVNRWNTPTYRVCLKCGEAQQRVNDLGHPDKFEQCSRNAYLDDQFDEKGNYIL